MFGLFKKSASPSSRERRQKDHDVEVKLFLSDGEARRRCGKIWQDTGKLSIQVREVASGHDGRALLSRNGEHIGEFPVEGRQFKFSWRGEVRPDMPKLEIEDRIVIAIGDQRFEGVVEAD